MNVHVTDLRYRTALVFIVALALAAGFAPATVVAQAKPTTTAPAKPGQVLPARTAAPKPQPVVRLPLAPVEQISLTQLAEAEKIARGAPDPREGARRLRQRGVRPDIALQAMRRAFVRPDAELFPALVSAGYPKAPLVDAIHALDRLDATGLDHALIALREPIEPRAGHLARLFPTLGADPMFQLLLGNGGVAADAFKAAHQARRTPFEALVAESARYHRSRQLPRGNGAFFPEPSDVDSLVRDLHPGTPQPRVWARLIAAGFATSAVFAQVPAGAISSRGIALDAVGGCLAQHFPGQRLSENPKVLIDLSTSGQTSHNANQAQCYVALLGALRQQSLPRAAATEVAGLAVACRIAGAPACETERTALVASMLESAEYPPEKR
jgi:hypothetical protein